MANDLNALQNRIQNGVDALRSDSALIRRTLHAIRRRELCIERDVVMSKELANKLLKF